MTKMMDNNAIWNEAGKGALFLGALSVLCLSLREWSTMSGSTFLITAASVILWVVEFFGCILIMKEIMIRFRDKYEGVKMQDTYKLGRRAALLSGLLLASAQALFIMKMPQEDITAAADQLLNSVALSGEQREQMEGMMDKLPIITFFSQWIYCYLYGTVLSAIMSRYVFLQKLFGGMNPPDDGSSPDEQ